MTLSLNEKKKCSQQHYITAWIYEHTLFAANIFFINSHSVHLNIYVLGTPFADPGVM